MSISKSLCKNSADVFLDRVINKFRESDYEKVEILIEIHEKYAKVVEEIEKKYKKEENMKVLLELNHLAVYFLFNS